MRSESMRMRRSALGRHSPMLCFPSSQWLCLPERETSVQLGSKHWCLRGMQDSRRALEASEAPPACSLVSSTPVERLVWSSMLKNLPMRATALFELQKP